MEINKIHLNDCLSGLKELPNDSIDCCISSPPYWGLRDYGTAEWIGGDVLCDHIKFKKNTLKSGLRNDGREHKGLYDNEKATMSNNIQYKEECKKCGARRIDNQIGQEVDFNYFIDKLIEIYDEVNRVLKPTGTCFVNLGDTFGSSGTTKNEDTDKYFNQVYMSSNDNAKTNQFSRSNMDKSLLMIPERFAIKMIEHGWTLRNQIIWHKPNQMPSPVSDRFSVDFEKVFFFTKQPRGYHFEQQLEPYTKPMNRWGGERLYADGESTWDEGTGQSTYRDRNLRPNPEGRNMRSVWSINTQPLPEAHFAAFPEKLVERMIKSGCPEYVCKNCGHIKEKIFVKSEDDKNRSKKFVGYSSCNCNDKFEGGVVLDPFMGAGTTALVAKKLNRNYIGFELNGEYIKIAERRILKYDGLFKETFDKFFEQ